MKGHLLTMRCLQLAGPSRLSESQSLPNSKKGCVKKAAVACTYSMPGMRLP